MNLELSDNVLIQCPVEAFAYIRVVNCLKCTHYQGLSQATVNGEPIGGNDPDSYQVICSRPITRRLHKVIK